MTLKRLNFLSGSL
uniref:Uncharacterized protein n=1 Tax=Anguilla anguilla TaxID=7936 RepID=A0A0E9QDA5_ANGAN